MPNKNLVDSLRTAYPNLRYKKGKYFKWFSSTKTIYYDPTSDGYEAILLHEVAHALLDHTDSVLDVELVCQEAEAWEYATSKLAAMFSVKITEDHIENAMESYRDWLHRRSLCPDCSASGLQTKNTHYKCIVCGCSWLANDARHCGLKRYRVKTV